MLIVLRQEFSSYPIVNGLLWDIYFCKFTSYPLTVSTIRNLKYLEENLTMEEIKDEYLSMKS